MTYSVVGCSDCSALWVVEGRPDTTTCPRCGTRHRFERLRSFAETDDAASAKEVRAAMLADRSDHGDAFDEVDPFADLEDEVDDAGMDEETYLESAGVDTEAVADAGDRAERGAGSGGGSHRDTVLEALRTLDAPTEDDVVAYASDRGVPESFTREALERLARRGRVVESGGTYRLM